MAFNQSRPKQCIKEESLPLDDESFSPDEGISRLQGNFASSYPPFCSELQQKVREATPKKRRNVKLQPRVEPSEEKMRRISERRGGYKRSTNNSHKKFICVAKRLLLKLLERQHKKKFYQGYESFKNSRTYYFIVLAHAKLLLPAQRLQSFRGQFRSIMESKVAYYQKEVERTDNRNFINFRFDEIADIHFALTALELYLEDRVEEAIETIYRRDRAEVLKKLQFQQAVQVTREVEEKIRTNYGAKQRQSVIILQHNAGQAKLEEKLQDKLQEKENITHHLHLAEVQQDNSPSFLLGLHPGSNFMRANGTITPRGHQSMPLLFLENSLPYYPYFSEIMFPYQTQIPQFHNISYLSNWCGQPVTQEYVWRGKAFMPMMEEGVKGSLLVGRTAVQDEEGRGMHDQQ